MEHTVRTWLHSFVSHSSSGMWTKVISDESYRARRLAADVRRRERIARMRDRELLIFAEVAERLRNVKADPVRSGRKVANLRRG